MKDQLDAHDKDVLCLLAVDSLLLSGSTDGCIKVWDRSPALTHRATLHGHDAGVTSLVCHPTRPAACFSAGMDRRINLWTLSTGCCAVTAVEPQWPVLRLAVTPEGGLFSCAGPTVRKWTAAGAPDAAFRPAEHGAAVYAAGVASGWLFTGDAGGRVCWWDATRQSSAYLQRREAPN
eukprot:EG_transcript_12068